MQPYYTIMRLPGEAEPEFIQMLPFTPRNRDNLAAWLVARSDGEHYGTLRVFQFPKQKVIFGPRQVVARISQDQTISPQITLWNQQGSQVIWGTLMVIPIEESLIYVRPLYLRASGRPDSRAHARHRRLPEPDRDGGDARGRSRAAVRRRRDAARPTSSSLAAPPPPAPRTHAAAVGQPQVAAGNDPLTALAAQARGHYDRAIEAQRAGDWAKYGEELRLLGEVLAQMRNDNPISRELPNRGVRIRDRPLALSLGSVESHARSTSATLQACAMQPRGVYGLSASKISLSVPMPASSRCAAKPSRQLPRARLVVGMDLEPCIDERADQPSPDRALVVGRVAGAQVAVVLRLVVAVPRRERAQADRRQQPLAHDVEDRHASARDRARDGRARSRGSDSAGTPGRRPARRRSTSYR